MSPAAPGGLRRKTAPMAHSLVEPPPHAQHACSAVRSKLLPAARQPPFSIIPPCSYHQQLYEGPRVSYHLSDAWPYSDGT